MHRPIVGRRVLFLLSILTLGMAAWMLLGAADAPEQGVLYLTAICGSRYAEIGTTDTKARIYVAVNSDEGYVTGLTDDNFRVTGLSDQLQIANVDSGIAPGVYGLWVTPARGEKWSWTVQNIALTVRTPKRTGSTVVQMPIE